MGWFSAGKKKKIKWVVCTKKKCLRWRCFSYDDWWCSLASVQDGSLLNFVATNLKVILVIFNTAPWNKTRHLHSTASLCRNGYEGLCSLRMSICGSVIAIYWTGKRQRDSTLRHCRHKLAVGNWQQTWQDKVNSFGAARLWRGSSGGLISCWRSRKLVLKWELEFVCQFKLFQVMFPSFAQVIRHGRLFCWTSWSMRCDVLQKKHSIDEDFLFLAHTVE